MAGSSKVAVYAALGANLAIAATKFAAFAFTGSSAMLSEAIHSSVDTGNEVLLLLGANRAAKQPDDLHPFGYGMEMYFWSFVVALLIFTAGGAASIYEGVRRLFAPEPLRSIWVSYVVLAASAAFEGASFAVAYHQFRRRHPRASLFRSIRSSKDPSMFVVLLEDSAALAGLAIAALGITVSWFAGWHAADAIASIAIGLLLVAVAAFLANETRSLLTGEAAAEDLRKRVREIVASDGRVLAAPELLTLQLGPQDVLVAITADFDDALSGGQIEQAARELTNRIRAEVPPVKRVFLRPLREPAEGPSSP